MRKLFFDDQGTLRSGWRVAIFFTAFVVVTVPLIVVSLGLLTLTSPSESTGTPLSLMIPFAISTAAALVLGWLCGKFFEGQPFSALGASFRKGWFAHLATGFALGAVTFLFTIVIVVASGSMSFSFNTASATSAIATTLGSTLVIFAIGAASEEALFRGYMLQTLSRSHLKWFGIAATSVLFAFAHNNNPGANPLALANTLLAGVWFALAYFKTRDLWFPFGIHLAWNWLQGPVFGISVSGITGLAPDPLLRAEDAGPASITGGNYGIEGGVACTVAILISIAVLKFGWKSNAETAKDAEI